MGEFLGVLVVGLVCFALPAGLLWLLAGTPLFHKVTAPYLAAVVRVCGPGRPCWFGGVVVVPLILLYLLLRFGFRKDNDTALTAVGFLAMLLVVGQYLFRGP